MNAADKDLIRKAAEAMGLKEIPYEERDNYGSALDGTFVITPPGYVYISPKGKCGHWLFNPLLNVIDRDDLWRWATTPKWRGGAGLRIQVIHDWGQLFVQVSKLSFTALHHHQWNVKPRATKIISPETNDSGKIDDGDLNRAVTTAIVDAVKGGE